MPKVSADYLSARRAHILDAAATRFAEQGFHRSSMQDVINEAFHVHFPRAAGVGAALRARGGRSGCAG